MPDKLDHFLIDIAVVLKAPNDTIARQDAEALASVLRHVAGVRVARICHIDPTSSPEQQLAASEQATEEFSVKTQEDGGINWAPTIRDRDPGDETDLVIRICRKELGGEAA